MNAGTRCAAIALPGLAMACVLLLAPGRSEQVFAAETVPPEPTRPFLLVEGWFDREYVSDLYTFTMDGRLIKRLTSEPLPTNSLVAVAPSTGDPYFIANAMAFYRLSIRSNSLFSIYSGNVSVPAISPDGSAVAFILRGGGNDDPARVVRMGPVAGVSSWKATQFPLVEAEAPAEMVFTPDGGQVLITYWPNYGSGRIIRVDLKSGDATTLLGDDHFSYNGPVFAPDGRTLLVVREDLDAARWSIVALPWPAANSPTAIITGPRGIRLSEPIFLGDGNRFLFRQRDALASATLDGRNVEALFGELDQKDVEGPFLRNMGVRRSNPVRPGWLPHVVTRYLATTQPRERASPTAPPQADVVLYDLQTRQRTVIPLANGQVKRVVVVE